MKGLDETGLKTDLARLRRWAKEGIDWWKQSLAVSGRPARWFMPLLGRWPKRVFAFPLCIRN